MSEKEFVIPFVGLKRGVHEFDFEIGDSFFESIEYSILKKGKINVNLSLDKKETMLVGVFTLSGTVEASCARCMEPVSAIVEGEFQLVYKYDDKPSEDESLVIVYPEDYEIDVRESILEFISVSIPSRSVHEEGKCDPEITKILSEYQVFAVRKEEYEDDEFSDDSDLDEIVELDEEPNANGSEDNVGSDEDQVNDEQLGDDEYVDPRWEALRKLKKK